MKQDILTQFPWPWLPTLALVVFFGFFMGLLVILSLKSTRPIFEAAEELPLKDDVPATEPHGASR